MGNWTQTGWQPFYAEAGGFATQGGEAASGNSTHITAYPGASLDFLFYGRRLRRPICLPSVPHAGTHCRVSYLVVRRGKLFLRCVHRREHHVLLIRACTR